MVRFNFSVKDILFDGVGQVLWHLIAAVKKCDLERGRHSMVACLHGYMSPYCWSGLRPNLSSLWLAENSFAFP